MRNLSPALSAALGAPVQKPAVFVYIGYSTPVRWSSFATATWSTYTWTAKPIDVSRLNVDALRIDGELIIDRSASAECDQVLSEGVQDRPITVWGYDAAATATADVVWLCDAVGGAVTVEEERVRIALRHKTAYMLSPRTFVNAAGGFNFLIPSDRPIVINNISVTLERRT